METKIVFQCRLCDRYKMTDGSWDVPEPQEMVFMILFSEYVELVKTICPDCGGER